MSSAKESMQTVTAGACFCFCSVGMMFFNKMAIQAFPLECTLVAMQMAFAALALLTFGWSSLHFGSFKDVCRWFMVLPFFIGMLLTSILALKNAPMSLSITLRALSPLGSLLVERFYPDPLRITPAVIMSIVVTVVGAAVYCSSLEKEAMAGVGWVVLNSLIATGDRLVCRLLLAKDQCPVDLSKTACTLISNAGGVIPLTIAAYCKGEFSALPTVLAALTPLDSLFILLTCVIGLGISYSGIWAQSLISATSFLVMINANKFFIIGIEAFGLHTKVLTKTQVAGASLTLIGAILYGRARQLAEEVKEKEPLLPQTQQGTKHA
eukprot:TRINITY_DN1831_c0_g1_i1.p1 TRINITY_DN1831_c0_g1~~TRINITY_DN1831_c0_g1_i1.p1  ORF type:complete len:323 (-),score=57.18 TRINITY_DN1831_c0_g1_i1:62-1030(-)